MKGVCANLGLDALAEAASELSEEFRPGNPRRFSDEEVKAKLSRIDGMYRKVINGIDQYING
jgi:HPt (histidine-containing phosphotransfer) domain-containing protein